MSKVKKPFHGEKLLFSHNFKQWTGKMQWQREKNQAVSHSAKSDHITREGGRQFHTLDTHSVTQYHTVRSGRSVWPSQVYTFGLKTHKERFTFWLVRKSISYSFYDLLGDWKRTFRLTWEFYLRLGKIRVSPVRRHYVTVCLILSFPLSWCGGTHGFCDMGLFLAALQSLHEKKHRNELKQSLSCCTDYQPTDVNAWPLCISTFKNGNTSTSPVKTARRQIHICMYLFRVHRPQLQGQYFSRACPGITSSLKKPGALLSSELGFVVTIVCVCVCVCVCVSSGKRLSTVEDKRARHPHRRVHQIISIV
jgi:hypothetical protein